MIRITFAQIEMFEKYRDSLNGSVRKITHKAPRDKIQKEIESIDLFLNKIISIDGEPMCYTSYDAYLSDNSECCITVGDVIDGEVRYRWKR